MGQVWDWGTPQASLGWESPLWIRIRSVGSDFYNFNERHKEEPTGKTGKLPREESEMQAGKAAVQRCQSASYPRLLQSPTRPGPEVGALLL